MSNDAFALGAGYLFALGLLLALIPLGWLVVGPRARLVLALVAVGLAAGIVTGCLRTRGEITRRTNVIVRADSFASGGGVHIASGPGAAVTASGAVLAMVSAIAGGTVGGRAPRLGLPEREDREPEP